MAFIDELNIYIKAGDGGDGVVRWRHEKNKEFGGPSGGDGGRGGSVYVVAVRNTHLLSQYCTKKEFRAERGKDGGKRSLHGLSGKDLDIKLPIGSIITDKKTGKKVNLSREGERLLLLKGGGGGRGNESFKNSRNTTPREFTTGKPGEDGDFFIEVELIADIGLIGLPNAGKTSLLNEMTNAKGKVASYPFTTLEPNLGEVHGYIISDIPGLVSGVAEGKGLGHKFLRHIRRTRILAHLISLENEDPIVAYRAIRKELKQFDEELAKKKEIVVLTKTDLLDADDPKKLKQIIKDMKKVARTVFAITLYDDAQIKSLQESILKVLD